MATLPCADGAGSLNNPINKNTNNTPYVAPELCVGNWTLTNQNPDDCENNDQRRQESYVAETISINGAPLNIFKLLGVHEQGGGSLLNNGTILSSIASPGFPISGINNGGTWKSLQSGPLVCNTAYIGLDFGIKKDNAANSAYAPPKQKWTKVGAVKIHQTNDPYEFASQLKVEYTTGEVEIFSPSYSGTGNGFISYLKAGQELSQGTFILTAISDTEFTVSFFSNFNFIPLPNLKVDKDYLNTFINLKINSSTTPFAAGDTFTLETQFKWIRLGLFNAYQSADPFIFKLKSQLLVKAIRVTPSLFSGAGNWGVIGFDVMEDAPSNINDIQDLFFNENRDRDYSETPILIKAQYNPTDSVSDLSRFGLSILDQYTFTTSFATVVQQLGRPLVVGDIIELIPELQYDHNLKPVRKFLEVTDTGWASEGFSTHWKPTVFRFSAQPAIPSQETRDIFGTLDTQKYLVADQILSNGQSEQLDTTPLTQLEEIIKAASNAVPETGDQALREVEAVMLPAAHPPVNLKGQPLPSKLEAAQGIYVEDALPKNGEAYTEGYSLPDSSSAMDGQYFRLNYAEHLNLPSRLYRFSLLKNRWLYLETDRRAAYSSHKPTVNSILKSTTQKSLKDSI